MDYTMVLVKEGSSLAAAWYFVRRWKTAHSPVTTRLDSARGQATVSCLTATTVFVFSESVQSSYRTLIEFLQLARKSFHHMTLGVMSQDTRLISPAALAARCSSRTNVD